MKNTFSWPKYPSTDEEFNALMQAVDSSLSNQGLKPFQRPLHVGLLFWEAFGWEGAAFPPEELAMEVGFEGDLLMAKAYQWYKQYYGEQLKGDFVFGFTPVRLGNALWRMRSNVMYGTVSFFIDKNIQNTGVMLGTNNKNATFNIFCAVENLPQGLVTQLKDNEINEYCDLFLLAHANLMWRDALPRTELFEMARSDYDSSTMDVLGHRYGQARWGAQQAVEKTIKGILSLTGTSFPTGGSNGHNLNFLGNLLYEKHSIKIETSLLTLASCNPKVRYGEELSTQNQALLANHAFLGVLDQLRNNPNTERALKTG